MSTQIIQTIEDRYRRQTPRSEHYYRAAQQSLPGGDSRTITFFEPYPLYIAEGQGQHLIDVDGNRYHDFLNNYTSLIHGHAHPALVEAITQQAAKGTAFGACAPVQVELAEELCRRVASVEQIRFCNSGTEATMNALRAARAFTGRSKILKIEGGYHGSHDLVEISIAPPPESAGNPEAPASIPEEPGISPAVIADVIVAPYNNPDALAALFKQHGDQLAAAIIEPVMAVCGTIPATQEFLQTLRDLCTRYGTLLIFDEVVTLRLSEGGAQELYQIRPDLTAFGKIIGGGLPVGAFGGRADIMALFAPPAPRMMQSGTYNANPITMAAGLAAMKLLTAAEIERINGLGERLAAGIKNAFQEMGVIGQVTGRGSIQTIHFADQPPADYRDVARGHSGLHHLLHLGMINRGFFAAKRGMTVISTPMQEADIDHFADAFADLLDELKPCIADHLPHLIG